MRKAQMQNLPLLLQGRVQLLHHMEKNAGRTGGGKEMTNKEYYGLTDEFVTMMKDILDSRKAFVGCVEMSIKAYRKFCHSHSSCINCPFLKIDEDCFMHWLNIKRKNAGKNNVR